MLSAINLTKKYPDGSGIENISISVHLGQAKIISGSSGSGKSTLLRILSLLDFPDQGILRYNDTQYNFPLNKNQTPSWPYPEISLVFQQLFLWPHLTNQENILIRPNRNPDDLKSLVDSLKLRPFLNKYPNQSSLGQRQRIALARALILRPRYLLLDEITSALDNSTTEAVCRILNKKIEQGMGIIAVSHDSRLSSYMSHDNSYRLENGELSENMSV